MKIKKMKCFLICILIYSISYSQSHDFAESASVFGRYGDCTTGRGICGIESENVNKNSTIAKFILEKENDSIVVLKIFSTKITKIDEVHLFGKVSSDFTETENMYFKMDTDLPISENTKTALSLPTKYTKIANGIYLVTKLDFYYLAELKLK